MLKIRYDLPPEHLGRKEHEVAMIKKEAQEYYLEETILAEDVADLTHGPAFLDAVTQPAGPHYPYPDRMIHFILMSYIPGKNLNAIHNGLQLWQLRSIRWQLSDILGYMRLRGFVLVEQHPSFLRYDEQNDKVYIVDYSFMDLTYLDGQFSQIIDEDSPFVLAFRIWPPSLVAEQRPIQAHRRVG